MNVMGKMRCARKPWKAESKKLKLYANSVKSGLKEIIAKVWAGFFLTRMEIRVAVLWTR